MSDSKIMQEWILPTFGAFVFWGLWAFIPKITTQHLEPRSAIVYEVMGAILLAVSVLFSLKFQLDVHPRGIALAIMTGMLGFLGAFCFLNAVTKGPVALVATLSSLYPVVSVVLAAFVLHETVTLKQSLGIVLALLAMMLVAS